MYANGQKLVIPLGMKSVGMCEKTGHWITRYSAHSWHPG